MITVNQILASADVERISRERSVIIANRVSMVSPIARNAAVILLAYVHCLEDRWEIAAPQIRYVFTTIYDLRIKK